MSDWMICSTHQVFIRSLWAVCLSVRPFAHQQLLTDVRDLADACWVTVMCLPAQCAMQITSCPYTYASMSNRPNLSAVCMSYEPVNKHAGPSNTPRFTPHVNTHLSTASILWFRNENYDILSQNLTYKASRIWSVISDTLNWAFVEGCVVKWIQSLGYERSYCQKLPLVTCAMLC